MFDELVCGFWESFPGRMEKQFCSHDGKEERPISSKKEVSDVCAQATAELCRAKELLLEKHLSGDASSVTLAGRWVGGRGEVNTM